MFLYRRNDELGFCSGSSLRNPFIPSEEVLHVTVMTTILAALANAALKSGRDLSAPQGLFLHNPLEHYTNGNPGIS